MRSFQFLCTISVLTRLLDYNLLPWLLKCRKWLTGKQTTQFDASLMSGAQMVPDELRSLCFHCFMLSSFMSAFCIYMLPFCTNSEDKPHRRAWTHLLHIVVTHFYYFVLFTYMLLFRSHTRNVANKFAFYQSDKVQTVSAVTDIFTPISQALPQL